MQNIYYAHVYSHINYRLSVWGNMATTADFNKIFKQQKDCVRAIQGVGKRAHTDPIFRDLNLLNLSDMVKLESAQIGYKITNGLIPKPISQLFTHGNGLKQHQ